LPKSQATIDAELAARKARQADKLAVVADKASRLAGATATLSFTWEQLSLMLVAAESKANSWEVVPDTKASRAAWKAKNDARIKRFEADPSNFHIDPNTRVFSQYVGGAAKAAARDGMSYAAIKAEYEATLDIVLTIQVALDALEAANA
jgi:hypothetical protein